MSPRNDLPDGPGSRGPGRLPPDLSPGMNRAQFPKGQIACLLSFALRRRMMLAALAGALAGLGNAPFDLWPLTILGLAVVHLMVLPTTRAREASAICWAAGAGYFALSLSWIVEPFLVDVGQHGWMAPFALVLMAAGMALFWGAAGGAARLIDRGQGARFAAATTLCFVLAGYLRGIVFTGFPWALPGHTLIDTPALQLAQWGGAMGLSGIVLGLSSSLALIFAPQGQRPVPSLTLWALSLAAIMGVGSVATPPPTDLTARPMIRLVQPNVPQHEKWDPQLAPQHFDRTLAMTAAPGPVDLVVWPETAVPAWLDRVPHLLPDLSAAAGGKPMIFGINRGEGQRIYNSLVQLDGDAAITAIYDKHHLVPFGEYIPLGDLLGGLGLRGLAQRDGNGFSPGPGPQVLDLPGIGPVLPLICYEGVFARDIAASPTRPNALLLITNDAWFGTVSGPYQHLAQARLRAVEQGLPMIRVANTGVSAMIDPAGRITARMALNTAGIRDVALPAPLPPTLYSRFNDLPIVLVLLCALAAMAVVGRRRHPRLGVDG